MAQIVMENIIGGVFGLLIGFGGVWTGFKQLGNHVALDRWHTTTGRVVERGVYIPNIATVSAPAYQYAALVKYVYQVDGKEYVNDCIHPKLIQLPEHSTRQWAQKKAESFADEVTVHYNPDDPSQSFLVQTAKTRLYIVIACSCAAILYGTIFLLTG